MSKDNTIIVYASCGEGHKKAAEALTEHFEIPSYDILDFSCRLIKKLYSSGYRFIVKYMPFLWYGIFLLTEFDIIKLVLDKLNFVVFFPFYNFLKVNKPRYVVFTHFFPLSIAKHVKKKCGIKIIVIITDIGVHPLWIDDSVDYYFAPLKYTKEELLRKKVPEKKITVTGIPLREGFRKKIDCEKVKNRLGLEKERTLLLFSSTTGNIYFLNEILKEFKKDFNCVVIYGKNKKAQSLVERTKSASVKGFSYYSRIWELMEIASFIITKPGGLTVFEALCKGKYLIFTHYIKGQEEINKEIVEKLGRGCYVRSFDELKSVINNIDSERIALPQLDSGYVFSQLEEIILRDG